MMLRSILMGAAILAAVPCLVSSVAPVRAQPAPAAREAELIGLHQLCDHGDRKACVRFGMMLGEMRERHAQRVPRQVGKIARSRGAACSGMSAIIIRDRKRSGRNS